MSRLLFAAARGARIQAYYPYNRNWRDIESIQNNTVIKRVWTPTEEGRILYKHMSGHKCSECDGAGEVETGIGMMVCDKCKGDGTP